MEIKSSGAGEGNFELRNILKINNKAICLLCIEYIGCDTPHLNSEDNVQTSHLQSEAHKMKVKSLFKECTFSPLVSKDTKYSEVVNNFVFDTSLYLGNEPSYITTSGYCVTCLICSKNLCTYSIDESLVDSVIFGHLQSELHKEHFKYWVCWIYFFNEKQNFAMISQSVIYCSFCKQSVRNTDGNGLLHALVDHLENGHNVHLQGRTEDTKMNDPKETNGGHHSQGNSEDATDNGNLEILHTHHQQGGTECLMKNYNQGNDHNHSLRSAKNSNKIDQFGNENSNHTPRNAECVKKNNCFVNEYYELEQGIFEDSKKTDYLKNEHNNYLQRSDENIGENVTMESEKNHQPGVNVNDKECHIWEIKDDYIPCKSAEDAVINESGKKETVDPLFEPLNIFRDNSGDKSVDEESCVSGLNSSESSETDDYDDALEVLTCPDCGELIEIINENAEFSLQLHSQKHRDLKSINVDEELEFKPNVDYVCPICQEIIHVFNKNIELSVSRHFEERKIDHEGFGFVKDDDIGPDMLTHVFREFPEALKKYENFLVMEENSIFCKLCSCTIPVKNTHNGLSETLREHLLSSYHEGQFKSLSKDLAMVIVDYNKKNVSDVQQLDLFETLISRHPLIKKNKQFIQRRKINYFCQLCQRHICHSPNEATLTLNFISHLRGSWHVEALKRLNKSCHGIASETSEQGRNVLQPVKKPNKISNKTMRSMIFVVSQTSFAVNMNQRYIKVKNGTLMCSICQLTIKFTRNGSYLKSHCISSTHNEILGRNASIFTSNLRNGKSLGNKGTVRLTALDEMLIEECFKPHLVFISLNKQDYRCILCNVVIHPLKQCFERHFITTVHKKNAFSANQQVKCSQLGPTTSMQGVQSTIVKSVDILKKKRRRRRQNTGNQQI